MTQLIEITEGITVLSICKKGCYAIEATFALTGKTAVWATKFAVDHSVIPASLSVGC